MNKKDIAHIKRQFKLDHDLLEIHDMLNVYIMKESSEIYHYQSQPFAMLDTDKQELYMGSFKKLLTGELDQKLFELKFQQEAVDHTQLILHQGLQAEHTEQWIELMLRIVGKMLADTQYPKDTVVTFIRGKYFKPTKSSNEEDEVSGRDEVYKLPFILCCVNITEQSEKTLMFDYVEREFKYNVIVDPIIKLSSPEAGFFFPSIMDNSSDANHILYSAGKVNEPNTHYIEEVLNAEKTVTAQEERSIFEEVVREIVGDQLDSTTLAHVYEEINQVIEDNKEDDTPKLDYRDVEQVLRVSGVDEITTEQVERAFCNVIDDQSYEFKARSIMPKYTSKSIKINTKVATISVSPQDLRYVKQVIHNGKRCLLIEVDEDTVIEGFTLSSETL
jgi:hypothetical protein